MSTRPSLDLPALGRLVVMFIVAVVLWDTPVIYPIKVFVVVLHEMSHGLMAIVTGGEIISIEISEQIGGSCRTAGGARFLIASAGYLGSILWGGAILIVAARTRWDNVMAGLIGVGLVILALVYVRSTFGFVFTIAFGVGLVAVARFASNAVVDTLMRFLGMTSCLYVVIDIKSDLIDRTGIGSDADTIADLLGFDGLSIVVGLVWAVIALAAFAGFLMIANRRSGRAAPGLGSDDSP